MPPSATDIITPTSTMKAINETMIDADDEANYHNPSGETGKKMTQDALNGLNKMVDEIAETARAEADMEVSTEPSSKRRKSSRKSSPASERMPGEVILMASAVLPEEECDKEGCVAHLPSAAMTGVDERYTRLCAAISGQIYKADNDKESNGFELESNLFEDAQPKVIFFDTHGDSAETTQIPPMVCVAVGKKMIIGWRGSSSEMDWLADFTFAPVISSRWAHVAKGVRAQGAYCSLVESDLTLHEERIINIIKSEKIEEIIFTGHSLAGGLANVANLMVTGEREKNSTLWKQARTLRSVRSIAFSPPMTAMILDRSDKKSLDFIMNKVGKSTCSIVYSMDPVPRAYANVEFMQALVQDAIDEGFREVGRLQIGFLRTLSRLGTGKTPRQLVTDITEKVKKQIANLTPVAQRFQHFGAIVYYDNMESVPELIMDKGEFYKKPANDKTKLFKDITYVHPTEADDKSISVGKVAADNHNFIVRGPGLAFLCEGH